MAANDRTKRIAKNTGLLYVRMLFLMLISLYTSRVVLAALGVEDYGIYNVVGGIVSMFTMISGALNASISRFITYELGTGDFQRLKKTFSASLTVQFLLTAIFIVVSETIGLLFLNVKMVIPEGRLVAANWVYQFSIITFALNLISVPYNATIVAHEEMSAFAYISIFEGIGKLLVAWGILVSPIDRLIVYSLLLTIISVVVLIIYVLYCKKRFNECVYSYTYDKNVLKKLFGFAGWNMIGATSAVLRDHGGNIIINLFFGPVVNAARGVAIQVNTAVLGFVNNFQMAMNPQITKCYASGDKEYMMKLVYQGARFSYYILFVIVLPIFVNAYYILDIWLVDVPEHSADFLRLVLVFSLCESLSGPLMTTMYATGDVRNYQIVVGGFQLLNLPLAYLCLYFGASPESVLIVAILVSLLCLVARLFMLKPLVDISPSGFLIHVVFNVFVVSVVSILVPFCASCFFSPGLLSFCIISILCILSSSCTILFVGCKENERNFLMNKLKSYNKFKSSND